MRFARSVLADYDRTRDEIAAVASGAAGRTSVGAMVVATPVLLARAVELLKAHSAQTTVSIEEGDLTRLLPRLRVGELDLFVGRLEPGYAAPDLETEALYDEPMSIVARPDHPLAPQGAARPGPTWRELPWVVPPPWASSRIKLEQMFYKHGLDAAGGPDRDGVVPRDAHLRARSARRSAFVARSVARHFEREGLVKVLHAQGADRAAAGGHDHDAGAQAHAGHCTVDAMRAGRRRRANVDRPGPARFTRRQALVASGCPAGSRRSRGSSGT